MVKEFRKSVNISGKDGAKNIAAPFFRDTVYINAYQLTKCAAIETRAAATVTGGSALRQRRQLFIVFYTDISA